MMMRETFEMFLSTIDAKVPKKTVGDDVYVAFSQPELDNIHQVANTLRDQVSGWSRSGRPKDEENPSRDKLYLRKYRADKRVAELKDQIAAVESDPNRKDEYRLLDKKLRAAEVKAREATKEFEDFMETLKEER